MRSKLLGTIMTAGVLVGACGGGTSAPASTAPSAAPATASAALGQLPKPELTKIRIGIMAITQTEGGCH